MGTHAKIELCNPPWVTSETISPSQYTGMEIAAMPKNMTNGSTNLPLFLAAMTPPEIPTRSQITTAPKISDNVIGAAAVI